MSSRGSRTLAILFVLMTVAVSTTAFGGEWKVTADDDQTSIKFGYLVQFRAESFDTADGMDTSKDLYLRRARLLLGGSFGSKWSYFIETDSPNLGKADAMGVKDSGDVYIQDWVVTYTHSDALKVDTGLLLIPFSHNSLQSAVTLLGVDYMPYSFLNSGPTQSRVGRDYGVLARGLLANKHVEYRIGLFDGDRGVNATNDFRYAGRVVYSVFESEAGLFYTGTTLGAKKILAFGAAFDHQEDYDALALDAFWDQPIGDGGNAVTVQLAMLQYDGDVFFTSLPKQDDLQGEAGFYFAGCRLMPFVGYAMRDYDDVAGNDEDITQLGLAYYLAKFNRVFKVSWGQVSPDMGEDRTQVLVQFQAFHY